MIRTYKHFNKPSEFLLGLSFKAMVQISLIIVSIIYLAINLELSLNSPFLLILGIVAMIIIAFIVKSSRDLTVKGFYSSFLLHPFQNHLYTWDKKEEGYQSIEALLDLKSIEEDYLISKEDDYISIIKLDNGISFHKYSKDDREALMHKWSAFLAKISSISNIKSYFWTNSNAGDAIQLFTVIDNYKHPQYKVENFIADEEFYIIIREKNPKNKEYKLLRQIKRLLKIEENNNCQEILIRLREKNRTLIKTLKSIDIRAKELNFKELGDFVYHWLPLNKNDRIEDKSHYLEHKQSKQNYLTKTYRLRVAPESGDLNFWIRDYINLLNCKSSLSIYISSRDSAKDRREAESKSKLLNQLNKSNNSYRTSVISESKSIADELIKKPYSFNLAIYITVYLKSEEELQELDNIIKQPIKTAELSSLERLQVKNWIYSLPLAFNDLSKEDLIFCNLDFAKACFPFVKSPSGTNTGPLLGRDLERGRPVFLDEYDRLLCHNRGINFIGDSGSGKTVAAKVSIKRRLEEDPNKYFYIIDNTADGWKFFINYFGGEIIELDNPKLPNSESLFAPFAITQEIYNNSLDFNNHLEKCLALLEIISNRAITNSEKSFLTEIFKEAYKDQLELSLSELIDRLQLSNDEKAQSWIEALSPFSIRRQGIYASLMDSKSNKHLEQRLILFTFSKIKTNTNYQNICIKLITDFIEDRIIHKKQTKTTLVLDEAWKILQNSQTSQGKELLTHLARAGRGLDLGLWTISQKPSDLPGEIHSSASISLSFQLKERGDRAEMARYANLNDSEKELIDSYEIRESGVCLFKTTRSSDLIKIELDKKENALCNSTRSISNLRQEFLQSALDQGLEARSACELAIKKLMEHEL